jgi:hypothetical protein
MYGIDLLFAADQNFCQKPICFGPSGNHFLCRSRAKNFANRGEQILAHNRIVFRQDAQ